MIKNNKDISYLCSILDSELPEPLEAYVIGGANLIAQEIIERETHDIDVISPPQFSPGIIKSIETIASREKLPKKWFNTMPSMDEKFLEPGWKERSILFFQGKNLSIYLLSRKDILGQKITAAADRTKQDVNDILAMNPTDEEWEFAHAWAKKYDGNPDWPGWIDKLVAQLKKKQHHG